MNIRVKTTPRIIKIYNNSKRTNFKLHYLNEHSFSLQSSKTYCLAGNNESDNWALSYLLTGWHNLKKGEISINDIVVNSEELRNISCYVGRSNYLNRFQKQLTVKEYIQLGINLNNPNLNIDEISYRFKLSNNRLNRILAYTGNEHWRASLAIGYAFNKKIYCFPYIDEELYSEFVRTEVINFIPLLTQNNGIVILPADLTSPIANLSNKVYRITY